MILGDVILEMSYEDPGDPPIWEDETSFLRGWHFARGRSNKLDPFGAGVADVRVDNSTGRFSPTYNAGPHFPNVIPMRRLRLAATADTGTLPFTVGDSFVGDTDVLGGGILRFPLYAGFIEAFPQTWPLNGLDSEVLIRAVDGFKVFNLAEFVWGFRYRTLDPGPDDFGCGVPSPGFGNVTPDVGLPSPPNDTPQRRIERVLDCLDWPLEDRNLDVGTSTVWGSTGPNIPVAQSALSYLQQIALTEGGEFFIDASGNARFTDRNHEGRYDPGDIWSIAAGRRHYQHNALDYDEERIVNELVVSSGTTGDLPVSDAASQDHYYRRTGGVTVLAMATGFAARAAELLAERAEPSLHIPDFVPIELTADDMVHILSRELLDREHVQELRPDPNNPSATLELIDMECRIEGISMGQQTNRYHPWEFSWVLSVTEL